MQMRLLQGLIFDVDGTLADTEEVHRQAFNRTFARYGLDWEWTPALYAELLAISGGRERVTHYARLVAPALAARRDFAEMVVSLHRAKTDCYADMLIAGEVRLRRGVERLLHEARANGISLGIATNSAWSNLKALLDNNLPPAWPTWFRAIETCDSVPEKKPSPTVYRAVLRRIDIAPASCIALEDTENGLRAATAAGLTTVITTHRFTAGCGFVEAAAVLDGLGDSEQPLSVQRGPDAERGYVNLAYLDHLLYAQQMARSAPFTQTQLALA